MKVLVACEESQRVCLAFRERGHEAYSCDIQDCSGNHPEYHIKGDAIPLINGDVLFHTCDGAEHYVDKWDLLIAHPPCTYLSNAGSNSLRKNGVLNEERYHKGIEAREFFLQFLQANVDKICVENPVPAKIYNLPKYTQIIQPYMFGHPYQKRTCLWLKGLPKLTPTEIMDKRIPTTLARWYNSGGSDRQKNRSKTFEGMAKAMAEQWG